jgi:hypothetical protein
MRFVAIARSRSKSVTGAAETTTVAVPDLEGSAMLVAVTA